MSDLLARDRLVFSQKAKIIEMKVDFAIRDEEGKVGRSTRRAVAAASSRFVKSLTSS
jgi:hypothetical protein